MSCGKIKSGSEGKSACEYKIEVIYGEKPLEECMRQVIRRLLINAVEKRGFEEEKEDI